MSSTLRHQKPPGVALRADDGGAIGSRTHRQPRQTEDLRMRGRDPLRVGAGWVNLVVRQVVIQIHRQNRPTTGA